MFSMNAKAAPSSEWDSVFAPVYCRRYELKELLDFEAEDCCWLPIPASI